MRPAGLLWGRRINGPPLEVSLEIILNLSKDDFRDVILLGYAIEAHILLLLHCLSESQCVCILTNIDGGDSIVDIVKVSDHLAQIGDFHIRYDEDVRFLGGIQQGIKFVKIEGGSTPEVFAQNPVDLGSLRGEIENSLSPHGGIAKIIDGNFGIIPQVSIRSTSSPKDSIG